MQGTAADIMTRNVISVLPETSVRAVAALLACHNISAVPVIDGTGTLRGMVSEGDLMAPFAATTADKREWWLGLLAEGERLAPEFLDYIAEDHRQAANVMTGNVVTVTPETSLSAIADLLTRHRIKRVPVLENGRVAGIVSRADLIRAMAPAPQAAH